MLPAALSCTECSRLWREHAVLFALRGELAREQAALAAREAWAPRVSLGERVQMAAAAQERVVRRIAAHERHSHNGWR